MPSEPLIRLHDIRAHEGSQARGWEELTFQLRPEPTDPLAEVRKTRAPDGGVEWYYVFPDGHEEGFQAKFNPDLAAALGGMRESVRAVAAKRPSMTRLTFLVPYDFTDSGTAATKSDQDRWDDAVAGWKDTIPGAASIEFVVVRAGEVLDELTRGRHAGRRSYWFGGTELTTEWFERRWEESRDLAGVRYTPEADTATALTVVMDGVVLAPSFTESLRHAILRVSVRSRRDEAMWEPASAAAEAHLSALQEWIDGSLEQTEPDGGAELPTVAWDLRPVATAAAGLAALGARAAEHAGDGRNDDLDRAMEAVESLAALTSAEVAQLSQERMAAVVGPAGQGKTHALMVLCRRLLDEGVPAVVVLGSRLGDSTWWDAMSSAWGGLSGTSDEFLQAMDSAAEASGRRGVIMIDALNETQAPRRWRAELRTLATQVKRYANLALIVSFRSDWETVVMDVGTVSTFEHPGLAGHESEALSRYCRLYDIPEPAVSALDPAFSSPLFLRMFCEVLQQEGPERPLPTRSDLFDRFATIRIQKVINHLELAPTTTVVGEAMLVIADALIGHRGSAVPRAAVEGPVDALSPGRRWPSTLFGAMASEGLVEVGPTFDGSDAVTLPFQAYSEHTLAGRFLDRIALAGASGADESGTVATDTFEDGVSTAAAGVDVDAVKDAVWLWRALAVLLPERFGVEIVDVLDDIDEDDRDYLSVLVAESFTDRKPAAFTARTLALLEAALRQGPTRAEIDAILELAVRPVHPADATWLHRLLLDMSMAERDACWSIGTYNVASRSSTYGRLIAWATGVRDGSEPELESVMTVLSWLLTSPNRFMRDEVSKVLVGLASRRLDLMAALVRAVSDVDDAYVVQRVFLAAYGALMVGGRDDLGGARRVIDELLAWHDRGLPVDVLARDSARGALAWGVAAGVADLPEASRLAPPYGADPPTEPPTASNLERDHGAQWGPDHRLLDYRAGSILGSCLTWMGDFNKYVVNADVATFTRTPLADPPPQPRSYRRLPTDIAQFITSQAIPPSATADDATMASQLKAAACNAAAVAIAKVSAVARRVRRPLRPTTSKPIVDATEPVENLDAAVEADWAGRWIAHRAIELGWTSERFADFEKTIDSQGRDAHKPERFGKKYQWIALHELLARLADNYHLTPDRLTNNQDTYQGPWVWFGRDLDPSLPPSRVIDGARTCVLGPTDETWAAVDHSDLGIGLDAVAWVKDDSDLPEAAHLFEVTDLDQRNWVALERYASWSRNDSRRRSMHRRARDIFFIQFAWLVPAGQGDAVVKHLSDVHLAGRWMPDPGSSTQQYLGEGAWSVIDSTTPIEPDVPNSLAEAGLTVRGGLASYVWEGSTHDCSIDTAVNVYRPTHELLGEARWVPYQAAWRAPLHNAAGTAVAANTPVAAKADDSTNEVDGLQGKHGGDGEPVVGDDDERIVVCTLSIEDDYNDQSVVLVERDWLIGRLQEIDADLVVGTLSEKTALPPPATGSSGRRSDESPIWTDITYVSLVKQDGSSEHKGPIVRRRSVGDRVEDA